MTAYLVCLIYQIRYSMNTIYIYSNSKMNREGFISNFYSYEVTEGIQLIKFETFGDTVQLSDVFEYEILFWNIL